MNQPTFHSPPPEATARNHYSADSDEVSRRIAFRGHAPAPQNRTSSAALQPSCTFGAGPAFDSTLTIGPARWRVGMPSTTLRYECAIVLALRGPDVLVGTEVSSHIENIHFVRWPVAEYNATEQDARACRQSCPLVRCRACPRARGRNAIRWRPCHAPLAPTSPPRDHVEHLSALSRLPPPPPPRPPPTRGCLCDVRRVCINSHRPARCCMNSSARMAAVSSILLLVVCAVAPPSFQSHCHQALQNDRAPTAGAGIALVAPSQKRSRGAVTLERLA